MQENLIKKDRHFFKEIKCSKCGKPIKVYSASREQLDQPTEQVCLECRPVYPKIAETFELAKKDKNIGKRTAA